MFLSMRVAAAGDEVFFFHRRHVWMPVTCHGMSNCIGSGACAHQRMDVSEAASTVAMI